jgi:hypothetical protein
MLALGIVTGACGSSPGQEDRMSPSSTFNATTEATIAEALTFGGIILPPSAKVLGVDRSKGMDQRFTLAVETDPASVDALLSGSKFTAPLQPGRKVFMPSIQGFNPDNGTDIASAQDRLPPEGDRTHTVTREILVDRTNATKPVVHLWLFTT